jgi:hypothetical protein
LLEQAAVDIDLAIELVQNVREPKKRREFQAAAAQRLHNYLASTMTLVDHSRRLMRYRSGPIADEFNKRKSAVLSNLEVPFLQDLRNYTLHRTLPALSHHLSMNNVNTAAAEMTSEVELSVDTLQRWDGWTASSRSFLKTSVDAVQLRPVVRRHGELVYELNAWLLNALAEANEPALADANELVVERNAVLSGGDRETAREMSVAPWQRDPD